MVLELLLISKKFNSSAQALVGYVLDIAKVDGVEPATILLAAHYIDEQNVSIFDAFHAALCQNEIISSDHVYDKLGISRIKLGES